MQKLKKEYCAEIWLQETAFLILHTTCAINAWKILRGLLGMKNIDNPLSEYQPPSKEALINFGIDISREAVEKYALEKFGRLPQSHVEMTFTRDSKIIEEKSRFMRNEV